MTNETEKLPLDRRSCPARAGRLPGLSRYEKLRRPTGQICVRPAQMPDFCRQQCRQPNGSRASGEISTDNPVAGASGTTIQAGSWTFAERRRQWPGTLQCRFGPNGAFQGVNQI